MSIIHMLQKKAVNFYSKNDDRADGNDQYKDGNPHEETAPEP